MRTYTKAPLRDNDLLALTFTAPAQPLTRALAITREANPNYEHGRGAKRRSLYEHQLDEILALVEGCAVQGAFVAVTNTGREVHAFELLHVPVIGRAPALEALRRLALRYVAWLSTNGPGAGWAREQSRARAKGKDRTRYQLPRRSWGVFWRFRRVAGALARVLRTLHDWWLTVIPTPRGLASTSKTEKPEREHGDSEHQVGARCRDHSSRSVGALLRLTWPPGGGPGVVQGGPGDAS